MVAFANTHGGRIFLGVDDGLTKFTIESNVFFNITFERDPKFKVSGVGSEESSVLSSDKILTEIKKNPKITENQLAKILGITQRAVEKQIASIIGGENRKNWV